MANDFAAVQKEAQINFVRNFEDALQWWAPLTDPIIVDDPNRTTYTEGEAFGVTTWAAQVASPTPIDVVSAGASIQTAYFESTMQLTLKEWNEDRSSMDRLIAKMARLGAETISEAMFNTLSTVDVTLHPLAGQGTPDYIEEQGGGASPKCADLYTYNPPNSAAFNQQNLFTTMLTPASLDAALVAHNGYKDLSGNRIPSWNAKPDLIVPSGLYRTARDIVSLSQPTYNGTGLQSPFNADIMEVRQMPGLAADPDDWFLWWSESRTDNQGRTINEGPIRPWIKAVPTVRVTLSPSSNHIHIVGGMDYGIWTSLSVSSLLQMHSV